MLAQKVMAEREIYEPRTGDVDLRADVIHVQFRHNQISDFPRLAAELLGEAHGHICLIIAKLRVVRNRDQGIHGTLFPDG